MNISNNQPVCVAEWIARPLNLPEVCGSGPFWSELALRIHYAQATLHAGDGASTLALKTMDRVNLRPNRKYQWLHEMVTCHHKNF